MAKIHFLLILFLTYNIGFAQIPDPAYFAAPMKIPLMLSGNFGELRSNHFHSGIDIKTQGRSGLPVYAPADGDISRIFVSPVGFGLALYIDHPNGTTTVYGHLQKFRDDIQAYVRSIQYLNESFSTDIAVPAGTFGITKGELIAYSGNSGSSGGPHLHFEIRDTQSEKPYNPLLFNFNIKDDRPPTIMSVMFYPLSQDSHVTGKTVPQRIETILSDGIYRLSGNPVLTAYGEIGLGVQTLDYLNDSSNRCGVYEIELYFDGEPVYIFRMDKLSFDESRYLNSHIDYAHYQLYRRHLHKTWVEPGNKLHNYPLLVNRGKLRLRDGKTHEIQYVIKDAYGNKSRLAFNIVSQQANIVHPEKEGIPFYYDKPNNLQQDGIEAFFESGSFYSDFKFNYRVTPSNNLFFSPVFKLHTSEVPAHKSFNLKIRATGLPAALEDKALLAVINEKSGKPAAAGGKFVNGWIEANVRQLGNYAVTVDTIPPKITPLNIQNRNTITNQQKISFRITDDFSGIATYRGEIDGKWSLFEYDAKNNLLEYYFDSGRMEFGKKHHLKLTVTDSKGNKSVYEADFTR